MKRVKPRANWLAYRHPLLYFVSYISIGYEHFARLSEPWFGVGGRSRPSLCRALLDRNNCEAAPLLLHRLHRFTLPLFQCGFTDFSDRGAASDILGRRGEQWRHPQGRYERRGFK